MTLSTKQIDILFIFTEKKLVRYYDLQVELVDHLAQAIEAEMDADKSLDFDAALQKVYTSFGLFGFAHIVQDKEKSLRKRNAMLLLDELKRFFTFPKLVFTITLFLVAFSIGNILSPLIRYYLVFASFIIFSAYNAYTFYKVRKASLKKLVLLQANPSFVLFGPVLLYEQFLFFKEEIQSNLTFGLVCVAAYIIQAAVIKVTKKIQQHAVNLYPEAFRFA